MRINELTLLLITSSLIAGCASLSSWRSAEPDTKPSVDTSAASLNDHETDKIPQQALNTQCGRKIRDLSVSWINRKYWCSPDELVKRIDIDIAPSKAAVKVSRLSIPRSNTPVPNVSKPTFKASSPVRHAKSDNTPESPRSLSNKSQPDPATKQTDLPINIPFASHREILGPRGTAKTRALLANAKSASKITLRGVFIEDELESVTSLERERFSVGRSLSVAKHWSEAGLDQSKITILHHDAQLKGRYVRVAFYD